MSGLFTEFKRFAQMEPRCNTQLYLDSKPQLLRYSFAEKSVNQRGRYSDTFCQRNNNRYWDAFEKSFLIKLIATTLALDGVMDSVWFEGRHSLRQGGCRLIPDSWRMQMIILLQILTRVRSTTSLVSTIRVIIAIVNDGEPDHHLCTLFNKCNPPTPTVYSPSLVQSLNSKRAN